MLFWLVGTAVLTVWFVFRDPLFDYRLLIVGSVAPVIVDAMFGGARAMHSVTFSVALLALLMAVTAGRKPIRKMLLGLPVGTMLYLVFSGAWTNATVFWWPFFGLDFGDAPHPVAGRGWWNVLLEILGLGLCWWIAQHAELRNAECRRRFWRTGQLAFV